MTPLKPLYLFNDEPIAQLESDHLDLDTMAHVIASAAIGSTGPFNIGVFGGWGHGKSSVMRLAQSLIADYGEQGAVVTVWVNAWKYEQDEHPIVPLVASIVDGVEKRLAEQKQGKLDLSAGTKEAFRCISRALRAIAYGFSAKTKVGIPGHAEIEAGFVAEKIIDRYDDLSVSPRDPLLDKSLYYHADELLAELPESDTADQPKVVVFIDDLDRCLPPKALRLLEGIKLVLAHRGFIFVMAVDRRIIDSFLEERYRTEYGLAAYAKDGSRYMDKLIQLPIYLPSHELGFEAFVEKLIASRKEQLGENIVEVLKELKGPLAAGVNRNPRALIRTVNRLLVDCFLWRLKAEKTETSQMDEGKALGLSVVARILEEHLGSTAYRRLARNQPLCERVRSGVGMLSLPQEDLFEGIHRECELRLRVSNPGVQESDLLEMVTVEMKGIESDTVLQELNRYDFLKELLRTQSGQNWLQDSDARSAIESILVLRTEAQSADSEETRYALQMLGSSEPASRCGAISLLEHQHFSGHANNERLLEILRPCLSDESFRVSTTALRAVAAMDARLALEHIRESHRSGNEDEEQEIVKILLQLLETGDLQVRESAVELLVRHIMRGRFANDSSAIEVLLRHLDDPNERVRGQVVECLGGIGGERVIDPLLQRLQDQSERVRQVVVECLGGIGSERVIDPLLQRLDDKNGDVKVAAVEALGRIGGERVIDSFLQRLQDQSERVRQAVVGSLGRIGGERVIDPILQRLDDQSEYVRQAAVESLGKIGGERVIDPILRHLDDQSEYVRRVVVEILGRSGGERVIYLLLQRLDDQSERVRRAVAESLGKIGGDRVIEPLSQRLSDKSEAMRKAAIGALANADNRVDDMDRRLFSKDLDARQPWLDPKEPFTEEHLLKASAKLGISKEDVKKRITEILRMYGLEVE